MFFLITWKEFVNRKMIDKSEIVKGDKGEELSEKMKTFNAQKRLTTTDYRVYNLTELLDDQSLEIVEKESSE